MLEAFTKEFREDVIRVYRDSECRVAYHAEPGTREYDAFVGLDA